MSEKKSEDIIDMFIIIFGIIFVITNGLFSLKNEWEEKFNYREIQKYELISASCFSEDSSNETAFKLYHLKELEEEYYILCTIQNDGTIELKKHNCKITLIKQDGEQKPYAEVSKDLAGNVREVILHVPEKLEILER